MRTLSLCKQLTLGLLTLSLDTFLTGIAIEFSYLTANEKQETESGKGWPEASYSPPFSEFIVIPAATGVPHKCPRLKTRQRQSTDYGTS